ncbi:MAG TPA: 4Fe-4S dicluster domain-containing protein [Candidatus Sulfomarinibacteraceae bacterium]|nr:4Fe-4S dicluster domain-containing protein [Candidatus Sulfomarinibacteraceae bacterium]
MEDRNAAPGKQVIMAKAALQDLFEALQSAGYTLVGPTMEQEAIVYEEIGHIDDLPVGWRDEQEAGRYRLMQRDDGRFFSFVVGPQSWKKYLYPSSLTLSSATANGNGAFEVASHSPAAQEAPRYAFIGVRGCEMAAIAVQDRVFLEGPYVDPHYKAVRERAFLLGVDCTEPGATCFCASMGTGPACRSGCDLSLTELEGSFLVTVGSELGAEMLAGCDWRAAGAFELDQARRLMAAAEANMGRVLHTDDLPDLLYHNLDHPRWDEVGERCLSCTNCTMVCPTCFCHTVQDVSDLSGQHTERIRVWDSCFNPDFSYVFGGNLRPTICSRYRQWLTHKLASWIDQFGTSGCVGCGRCITWCPVGIDLTAEVAAIRATVEA